MNEKYNEDEKARLEREYDELTDKEKQLDLEEKRAQEEAASGDYSEQAAEGLEEDGEESKEGDNSSDDDSEENEEDSEKDEEDSEDNEEDSDEDDSDEDSKEKSDDEEEGDFNDEDRFNSRDRKRLNPDRKIDNEENSSDSEKSDEKSSGSLKDKASEKITQKISDNNQVVKRAAQTKELAAKGVAAVKGFISSLAIIGKLLINPVFWIIIAVVIGVIAIISTMSVIGGNDYNKLCDNNGVGGVSIGDDVDDFTRQSAIAAWLMSTPFDVLGGQPMSREQAMGVMGNLIEESGGANPKAIQSGYKNWETCDNDCVAAFVGGGKAVGIVQWDGNAGDPRRDNLVKLAREEGTQWWDLNTQLKHLKMELDGEGSHKYENSQIKKGFTTLGKSVEEYTELWAKDIERCGKCRMEERKKTALAFDQAFSGSAVSGGGGMTAKCVGGGGGAIDSSSIAQLAIQIAYTREEKKAGLGYGNCGGNPGCGVSFSKPEYISAKDMVYAETGKDTAAPNLMASCDRLVAIMVRATGIDTNFPYGNTGVQVNYMNSNPGWSKVSCQNKQPGDVFGRSGHIMIYVGEIDGKETMVSASIGTRSAHMSNISCSGDLFRGDNMSVPGWRKVN